MKYGFSIALTSIFLMSCSSDKNDLNNYLKLDSETSKKYWGVINNVHPKYDLKAMKNSISGCVVFDIAIDDQGELNDYKVKSSYPEDIFVNNSIKALQKYKWQATSFNESHKPVLTTLQMDFRVEGETNLNESKLHCDFKKAFIEL